MYREQYGSAEGRRDGVHNIVLIYKNLRHFQTFQQLFFGYANSSTFPCLFQLFCYINTIYWPLVIDERARCCRHQMTCLRTSRTALPYSTSLSHDIPFGFNPFHNSLEISNIRFWKKGTFLQKNARFFKVHNAL